MSSPRHLISEVLEPKDDLNETQFDLTYLSSPPDSYQCDATTYKEFTQAKLSQTPLLGLFELFYSHTLPTRINPVSEDQQILQNWYFQLCSMKNQHMLILTKLYTFLRWINSLKGYKNSKEYLKRALVANQAHWMKLFDILVRAAKDLDAELTCKDIIAYMELDEPSIIQKAFIVEYLLSIKAFIIQKSWYFNMEIYEGVTSDLLELVGEILQRNGISK